MCCTNSELITKACHAPAGQPHNKRAPTRRCTRGRGAAKCIANRLSHILRQRIRRAPCVRTGIQLRPLPTTTSDPTPALNPRQRSVLFQQAIVAGRKHAEPTPSDGNMCNAIGACIPIIRSTHASLPCSPNDLETSAIGVGMSCHSTMVVPHPTCVRSINHTTITVT